MAPKRKCKFNEDWRSFDSNLPDNGMARCNLCATDFSISSGGRTDVRRHQESARHAKLAKSNAQCTPTDWQSAVGDIANCRLKIGVRR